MFKNKGEFKKEFVNRLVESYGCTVEETHSTEKYMTLGNMVRDYASINWKDTKVFIGKAKAKQVYYFSMEFLLGKMLTNNLKNLGVYDMVVEGLKDLGIDYDDIAELETDPGLGNGGLGRLAACFLDSAATKNYPVHGNCICYQYGLFKQLINRHGEQVEMPDIWRRIGDPWEIKKPKHAVDVQFGGDLQVTYDQNGDMKFATHRATHVIAVPYDMPMIGSDTRMVNTLRLWYAEPADVTPRGIDYRKYLSEVDDICLNVYPDDSTEEGRILRLKQQYFFVCAGINSIIKTHLNQYKTLENLGEKVAIQLNDTHPVLVIPELMRVLMDDYGMQWEAADKIVHETVAYTNHTVLAEALEKWPVKIMQTLLPRIFMIIEEIDRRFCADVMQRFPEDPGMIDRTGIIQDNQVHMARLAVIGSHSVNGVAKIHSEILKDDLFSDYYRLWPERFNNKTNGVTPRRWLMYANPELRSFIGKKIGKGWETDYSRLENLMKYVDDEKTQEEFLAVKLERKKKLAAYILKTTGIEVDINSVFDVQAKRLHAYKRQLLNVMNIIYRYQRIKSDPSYRILPHTYIFAAKAASSYVFAKRVIKLINCVAKVINNDPDVNGMIKVVFLPNYCVSMSEVLVAGADVSEQISTAGKEASGTGNMKSMMNGAVTLGTMDGANIEIDELVGRENDIIFGHTVEELNDMKWTYSAGSYMGDGRIASVMNTFINPVWSDDAGDFRLVYDEIMTKNDEYYVLADFDSYVAAQDKLDELYGDRSHWARICLNNIARSGYFSSDRTIEEYARQIWKIRPVDLR